MISPSKYNKKVTKSVAFFVGPPKARTNLFQRCGFTSNYVFLFSKILDTDLGLGFIILIEVVL